MKHAHIIGICGVGMSATAILLKEAGYAVSGSDAECYGPPKTLLAKAGIDITLGYDPKNIPSHTDFFVIGRNAKLVPSENTEVAAAYESGKPILSFPEAIGQLTQDRHTLVVAGSYGKSTTTALVAHILQHAGVDAGYLIGAEPLSLPLPARLGSELFVVEGDEYPAAHGDNKAKFMYLHPTDVLLTSVVHDHVNVYPTPEEYEKPFRALLELVPSEGMVVVSAEEPSALALAEGSGVRYVSYGVTVGEYHATHIHLGFPSTFTLVQNDRPVAELSTTLLGVHNIEDIIAASAYVLSRELVTPEQLKDAIAAFTGVRRRLDCIAPEADVPMFEGFGSSYEKAVAAMKAMHSHFPTKKLVVVFEPHTFGWRNRANLSWYDSVFRGAHTVFVAPPETQGATTHAQLSHEEIMKRVAGTGISVHPYEVTHPESVVDAVGADSVILVLTSGDLEGSLPTLVEALTARFPRS